MKDITTIILRLTISCLMAGAVMGVTLILTHNAKKHNAHLKEQRVSQSLLGYSEKNPPPETMDMHEVYRYIVTSDSNQSMGYLLTGSAGNNSYTFIMIDLDGQFVSQNSITIAPDKATDESSRTQAIASAIGADKSLHYADQTIVVTDNGKRVAYLLPGKFPGFKTFINVMMALDNNFTIIGLEVMEHEEDPGLGAEITQKYFKNQFKGKTIDTVKTLDVSKIPLPDDYLKALEADGQIGADEVASIEAQYKDKDIYALTGATISSRAVSNGVKGMVQKFAYRLGILDRVLTEQQIIAPF